MNSINSAANFHYQHPSDTANTEEVPPLCDLLSPPSFWGVQIPKAKGRMPHTTVFTRQFSGLLTLDTRATRAIAQSWSRCQHSIVTHRHSLLCSTYLRSATATAVHLTLGQSSMWFNMLGSRRHCVPISLTGRTNGLGLVSPWVTVQMEKHKYPFAHIRGTRPIRPCQSAHSCHLEAKESLANTSRHASSGAPSFRKPILWALQSLLSHPRDFLPGSIHA